jgi:hypothetical protein
MPTRLAELARLAFGVTLLAAGGCASGIAEPTDEPDPAPLASAGVPTPDRLTPAQREQLEAQMIEMARPGPEHQILQQMAGSWDLDVTFSMGPEPVTMTGAMESSLALGGRFLVQKVHGTGDAPMESLTILGFDRRHGVFTMYGCDTAGTYCVSARGPWNASTRTIEMYGEDVDPIAEMTQRYDVRVTVEADRVTTKVVFKAGSVGNAEDLVGVQSDAKRR